MSVSRSLHSSLIFLAAIVLATTLFYVHHQADSLPSRRIVPAAYLTSESYPLNNTYLEPDSCHCYSYHANTSSSSVVAKPIPLAEPQSHAEESPLLVQETLIDPPEDMLDKINANLYGEGPTLIATAATYSMRAYVYNWIESLKRTGEPKFLIFCLDDKLCAHLMHAGYESKAVSIPHHWFDRSVEIDEDGEENNSEVDNRHAIAQAKSMVIQRLLYRGITVLFADADVVWLRSRTREFLRTYLNIRHETHAIFQQDILGKPTASVGFFIIRPTEVTKRLMADLLHIQHQHRDRTQQAALNEALDHMNMDMRTTNVMLLDMLHFPVGSTFFDKRLPEARGVRSYVVHANHQNGDEKKAVLKERGYWYIHDEWVGFVDSQVEQTWKLRLDAAATDDVQL
ncbi:hypothetical protein DFQ28_005522 [Apophysomyces sp. BC1034]|nr:hypothetical protein DFQ30_006950 [Apophysomyces sp. BC1015]KAG0177681.1 hypothetical protein DFQ29_004536 [Apophysomyces sp. BC1021]KAG0187988.1 hypothetical protein DFQ28_005522 [Apophysomyces sp. BC1034]